MSVPEYPLDEPEFLRLEDGVTLADEQYVRDVEAGLDPPDPVFVRLDDASLEPDPELERRYLADELEANGAGPIPDAESVSESVRFSGSPPHREGRRTGTILRFPT